MNTKLVTGYWMDIDCPPYYGVLSAKKERYLSSLITHNSYNIPIVCYTHQKSFEELSFLKEKYGLSNVEIKIKELHDVKYHTKYQEIRDKLSQQGSLWEHEIAGRPPEVLWGKFDVLEYEIKNSQEKYIYWIDVGLHYLGVFPLWSNPYKDESNFDNVLEKKFNFTKILNKQVFESLENKLNSRIVTLVNKHQESAHFTNIEGFEGFFRPNSNPVAGFFGGDKNILKKYCESFWDFGLKHLNEGIICHEQSVMKHIHNTFNLQEMVEFVYETHQYNVDNFHEKLWESENDGRKPLYTCFLDIVNNQF